MPVTKTKKTVISAGSDIIVIRSGAFSVSKAIFLGQTKHKVRVREGINITQIPRLDTKIVPWDAEYFNILAEAAEAVHRAKTGFFRKADI